MARTNGKSSRTTKKKGREVCKIHTKITRYTTMIINRDQYRKIRKSYWRTYKVCRMLDVLKWIVIHITCRERCNMESNI